MSRVYVGENGSGSLSANVVTGTYYVKVDSFYPGYPFYDRPTGTYNYYDPYILTVAHVTGEPSEPNGTVEQAAPITSGVPITAFIEVANDADYFAISVPVTAARIRVDFTMPPSTSNGNGRAIRLFRPDGTSEVNAIYLWPNNSGSFSSDVFAAGTYYVKVDNYHGSYPCYGNCNSYNLFEPYRLTVDVWSAHFDPGEPNDAPAQARQERLQRSVRRAVPAQRLGCRYLLVRRSRRGARPGGLPNAAVDEQRQRPGYPVPPSRRNERSQRDLPLAEQQRQLQQRRLRGRHLLRQGRHLPRQLSLLWRLQLV